MAAVASTAARNASACSPTVAERPRESLHLVALGAGPFGEAVRQLHDLERLDEERAAEVGGVVDDPRHALPRARPDGEHRPAAALRHEVLLQMLAPAARADELLEPFPVTRWQPLRSSARSLQAAATHCRARRAVLFDSAADRLAERLQSGVDRGRGADRSGVSTEPRTRSRPSTVSATCRAHPRREERRRARELWAARGRRGFAQLGLERLVEGAIASAVSACQCAPPRPDRARALAPWQGTGAPFSRRCGGDPLEDRRRLETVEREGVHHDECGAVPEEC